MSLLSTAGTGFFSSDRTIAEYAKEIWNVQPCRRPGPVPVPIERLSSSGVVPHEVFSPVVKVPRPCTVDCVAYASSARRGMITVT